MERRPAPRLAQLGLTAVDPTPTGVIRAVGERLNALERDVRAARGALAVAETELLAAYHTAGTPPEAMTTDQVARQLSLSRSTVAPDARHHVTAPCGRHTSRLRAAGTRRTIYETRPPTDQDPHRHNRTHQALPRPGGVIPNCARAGRSNHRLMSVCADHRFTTGLTRAGPTRPAQMRTALRPRTQ